MDARVEKLFKDFETAFSTLDIRKNVELYTDTFISAGPKGVIANSKQDFIDKANETAAFYKSVGQTGAKAITMKETPISHDYTMVTVHWGVTFQKTGDEPVEFDVSYIVHLTDKPEIIMFISHEDEGEAMKKLGVMSTAQS